MDRRGKTGTGPSRRKFLEQTAAASMSERTRERFESQRDLMLRLLGERAADRSLHVADVGGGAGTLAMLWARHGHAVHCLDIDPSLIEIGRRRASAAGLDVEFRVGSAAALSWADASMDVCLAPGLLEHVDDWKRCLEELGRVLRPGGLLYVSTTNVLCPAQQEFRLPLYSW